MVLRREAVPKLEVLEQLLLTTERLPFGCFLKGGVTGAASRTVFAPRGETFQKVSEKVSAGHLEKAPLALRTAKRLSTFPPHQVLERYISFSNNKSRTLP
jgi:hypothetical protein